MTKLKSMTTYVLEQSKEVESPNLIDFLEIRDKILTKIENYGKFLSMPLELKMFVPVDDNGNLLEEPEYYELWKNYGSYTQKGESIVPECVKYHKASSEVLFEGFTPVIINSMQCFEHNGCTIYDNLKNKNTIESLVKLNLTLIEQARDKYKF